MSSSLSSLADDLADYLNNAERLPFLERRFVALRPSETFLDLDSPLIMFDLHLCDSEGQGLGRAFGDFWVQVRDGLFRIEGIDTQGLKNDPRDGIRNAGRELVRRSYLFAKDRNLKGLGTSVFLQGAASFWIGLGFATTRPVPLDWRAVRAAPDAELWAERVEEDPLALSDLAQTPLGRKMLALYTDNTAFLDFNDKRRCLYAARRLKLPGWSFGA